MASWKIKGWKVHAQCVSMPDLSSCSCQCNSSSKQKTQASDYQYIIHMCQTGHSQPRRCHTHTFNRRGRHSARAVRVRKERKRRVSNAGSSEWRRLPGAVEEVQDFHDRSCCSCFMVAMGRFLSTRTCGHARFRSACCRHQVPTFVFRNFWAIMRQENPPDQCSREHVQNKGQMFQRSGTLHPIRSVPLAPA